MLEERKNRVLPANLWKNYINKELSKEVIEEFKKEGYLNINKKVNINEAIQIAVFIFQKIKLFPNQKYHITVGEEGYSYTKQNIKLKNKILIFSTEEYVPTKFKDIVRNVIKSMLTENQ